MGTLTDLDWYLCRDRYLFIDFETPEAAHAAVKNLDGHKMSKSHQLSVNKFTDVEKYTSMSDEYVEPEVAEYKPKEHLKSWLMDPQARDQFVMYRGDDVTIYWNNKAEKPEFVKSKNVCVTFWGRKGSSSLVFFLMLCVYRTGPKCICNGPLSAVISPPSMPWVSHCGVVPPWKRLFVSLTPTSS